ncbi:hypothetical protein niasHT_027467 [Heterodera trifolii]|uniref:Fido domain-containing protein n=1 Tax=Heterodera trifolii TaxID=157864 RepID=A0ABD2JMJ8_9BILA
MSIPQQFGVAAMVAELMRQNWETWSTFDDDDLLLRLLEAEPNSFLHAPTLTIEHIFRLHHLALGAHHLWAGKFRRVNVQVGDFMIPVEWSHVPARIKGLLGWVNEEEARIREVNGAGIMELVAIFQHRIYLIIHPHRDANGRVSHLFANLLLIQRGLNTITYLPAVPAQETQYFDALVAASSHNNPMPFITVSAMIQNHNW